MKKLILLKIALLFFLSGCSTLREIASYTPNITNREYALKIEECYKKPEYYHYRTEPRGYVNYWNCPPDK